MWLKEGNREVDVVNKPRAERVEILINNKI
jgi:hypothetical protein